MRTQVQFRLLVVRLGAMGDILHALPALTALRKAHPTWQIGWAVEPRWVALLTSANPVSTAGGERGQAMPLPSMPLVDRIHLVPAKAWGRKPLAGATWSAIRGLRAELKDAQYEAVLDMQGAIRSGAIARLAGCGRVIGSAEPWEKPARWLYSERVETAGAHVIEQNVELASAVVGDLLMPAMPLLPVDAAAEAWCDALEALRAAREAGRLVVLLHPGGGWGAKRWPAQRYGVLAEEFAASGALVLVNAGPGEEALAADVRASAHGRAEVVVCSLPQLIALTRRVSLVIGGDTGPVHLACAVGKPVVGIYGPTDPKRNGPYGIGGGSRVRVLRNPESRRDHSRHEQPEAGLLTILPEAVMSVAIELMVEERRRHVSISPMDSGSGQDLDFGPVVDGGASLGLGLGSGLRRGGV